jgi:hypothetical protein
MTQELRRLIDVVQREAENDGYKDRPESDSTFEAKAMLMDAILELLNRVEKAEKDAARLDWLEQNLFNRENVDSITGKVSKTHNMWVTFAPVGVQGSARRIIDSAMEASK